jgi:hypothetical protein
MGAPGDMPLGGAMPGARVGPKGEARYGENREAEAAQDIGPVNLHFPAPDIGRFDQMTVK